jgi:hypothetical protein
MSPRQNKGERSTSRSSWTQKRHPLDTGMDLKQMRTLRKGNPPANENVPAKEILSDKDSLEAKDNLVAEENPRWLSTPSQLPQRVPASRDSSPARDFPNTQEHLESKPGPFLAHFPMLAPVMGYVCSRLPRNDAYSSASYADVVRSPELPSDHSGPSDSQHNGHGESA